jgi:hypothetical protein
MATWKPFVELKTSTGIPIKRRNMTITPQAQALVVRLPYYGFVWNRPVAMLVEMDGRRERFPILDVTRVAVLAMVGAGVALSLGAFLIRIFGRGTSEE